MTTKPLHIALLAGETSGDLLGAPLLTVLRNRLPAARFTRRWRRGNARRAGTRLARLTSTASR